MIFLDTSAIYAWSDIVDAHHHDAFEYLNRILNEGEALLLHNYIAVEAIALLQNRLGMASAIRFQRDLANFQLHWITQEDHSLATALFQERGRRHLSFVDCASFVVMRRHGLTQAFAFDADFEREGFNTQPGNGSPQV